MEYLQNAWNPILVASARVCLGGNLYPFGYTPSASGPWFKEGVGETEPRSVAIGSDFSAGFSIVGGSLNFLGNGLSSASGAKSSSSSS